MSSADADRPQAALAPPFAEAAACRAPALATDKVGGPHG